MTINKSRNWAAAGSKIYPQPYEFPVLYPTVFLAHGNTIGNVSHRLAVLHVGALTFVSHIFSVRTLFSDIKLIFRRSDRDTGTFQSRSMVQSCRNSFISRRHLFRDQSSRLEFAEGTRPENGHVSQRNN